MIPSRDEKFTRPLYTEKSGVLSKMDLPQYVSPREELNVHTWAWTSEPWDNTIEEVLGMSCAFPSVILTEENRNALLHWKWSNGTAAVRGDCPFTNGNSYYWEIQISTPTYGTDVMVGVGTANVKLSLVGDYVSLLGMNDQSWGLSYTGKFHHNGRVLLDDGARFGVGDVVGLHLDMWFGSLAFFINGVKKCVVNDISLKKQTLYPMVCSTSASSCFKLIYSYSTSSNSLLQKMCLEMLESDNHTMSVLSKIPGLSKECTKRFLKAKDIKGTEVKPSSKLEKYFHYLSDADAESSDGECDLVKPRSPGTVDQKATGRASSDDCVKCGRYPHARITRSSISRLCKTCADFIEIDILYSGI